MTTTTNPDPDLAAIGRRIMRKAEVLKLDMTEAPGENRPGRLHDVDEIRRLGELVAKHGGANG